VLSGLLALLRQNPRYRELLAQAQGLMVAPSVGLSLALLETARPFLIAALQSDWPGPVVIVSGRPEDARHLADQVRVWSTDADQVLYFQAPDAIFYDRMPWDRETIHARVNVLSLLTALRGQESTEAGRGLVIATSVWALMTKSVSPLAFRRAMRTLQTGDVIPPHQLLEQCVRAGYEPVAVVEEPGTFSRRGSLIDIYPPNRDKPLRLDFFGDELDSIRTFDPAAQRSEDRLQTVTLAPAHEALPEWGKVAESALRALDLSRCNTAARQRIAEERDNLVTGESFPGMEYYLPYLYPHPSTLLDFLPRNALVVMDDTLALESAALNLENQALSVRAEMMDDGQLPSNFAVPYLSWEELKPRLAAHSAVGLGYGQGETHPYFDADFVPAPTYGGQLRQTLADIAELRGKGQRVVLITRQAERLTDLLREEGIYVVPTDDVTEAPEPGSVYIIDGIAAEGWAFSAGQLVVLTDAELFGWTRLKKRRPARRRKSAPETFFADLEPGDYVVHIEYGIGRYHGIVRKSIGHIEREYLEIEFAAGDRLFVPIHQADQVSRYLGADEREPYMHRLGTSEWNTVRAKAEKAVRDIAAELLELYASREVTSGYAFSADTQWQHELEESFPYEETEDQLRALIEVKADMEKPKPMDRLICGDVGYGKTEVALRAAFKAVMDGKQVAVLVPTTILAQQHFYTFRRRLRAFPVVVEMLSRFRSPEEQEAVIEDLALGKIDIIIGTHRLLSNDVTPKDLGLLIIDEEQRFGVSHKERLKQLRREVDVLTLTATPIPRTLYMSLSGIRDMSVIDTPPEERLPVRTYVSEHDPAMIRKAILREMDRGGQVYFVHNRVQDIELVAADLQDIVPEARLAVGHGQMNEDEMAQVMLGFAQGEYDVLVCTTIIESGLDIPNVNTIIIDRADTFGLAQLYQLRGRVGRSINRAYAYLFYKPPLTEIARKRLQTIQEAAELGAGFRVAMRDLEIRGAGEILGAEQHGHIAAVGFDLYCRLLQQAVEELRDSSGESLDAIHRAQHAVAASTVVGAGPSLDLPLSAYLPDDFMPDSQLRLRFYRRLARVDSLDELDELTAEFRDRFGQMPEAVSNLFYLLKVRILSSQAGIPAINSNEQEIALVLPTPLSPADAGRLGAQFDVRARGPRIWLSIAEGWPERLVALLQHLVAPERALSGKYQESTNILSSI